MIDGVEIEAVPAYNTNAAYVPLHLFFARYGAVQQLRVLGRVEPYRGRCCTDAVSSLHRKRVAGAYGCRRMAVGLPLVSFGDQSLAEPVAR